MAIIICVLAMSSSQQNVTTEETSKYSQRSERHWNLLHIYYKMIGSYLPRSIEYLFPIADKQQGDDPDKGKDKYNYPCV